MIRSTILDLDQALRAVWADRARWWQSVLIILVIWQLVVLPFGMFTLRVDQFVDDPELQSLVASLVSTSASLLGLIAIPAMVCAFAPGGSERFRILLHPGYWLGAAFIITLVSVVGIFLMYCACGLPGIALMSMSYGLLYVFTVDARERGIMKGIERLFLPFSGGFRQLALMLTLFGLGSSAVVYAANFIPTIALTTLNLIGQYLPGGEVYGAIGLLLGPAATAVSVVVAVASGPVLQRYVDRAITGDTLRQKIRAAQL